MKNTIFINFENLTPSGTCITIPSDKKAVLRAANPSSFRSINEPKSFSKSIAILGSCISESKSLIDIDSKSSASLNSELNLPSRNIKLTQLLSEKICFFISSKSF